MSIYSDCFRAIRIVRGFMVLMGLWPVNMRVRTLQISLVFILVAAVSFLRLWNSEQSVFQSDSEISKVVNVANLLMLWIVHIVILLETSCKTKQCEDIILQFRKIEKSLLQQNCEAPSVLKLQLRALKMYVFLILEVLELFLLVYILHMDDSTWFRTALRVCSEISLKAKLSEFMLFVFLTNAILQDLCVVTSKTMNYVRATKYNRWAFRKNALKALNAACNIRNEIWFAVKTIEDLFEGSLIGVLVKMYCDITFTAYWVYINFDAQTEDSSKIISIIILIIRGLILLACFWICNSCEILESNFITKLPLEGHKRTDTHLKLIIKDLSLELLHKRIEFSAGDIIAINFRNLGGMIFSGIMYVVILIQFRMAVPRD